MLFFVLCCGLWATPSLASDAQMFDVGDQECAQKYQAGVDALSQKHYEQAIVWFESVLFRCPTHLGARFSLIMAHCSLGNQASCGRVGVLLDRVEAVVTDLNPSIFDTDEAHWFHRTSAFVGYSDNINHGAGSAQLSVSLSGLPVELMLAKENVAQASAYTDVQHESRWRSSQRSDRWQASIQGYSRGVEAQSQAVHLLTSSLAKYWMVGQGQTVGLGVQLSKLQYLTSYQYTGKSVMAEVEWHDLWLQPRIEFRKEHLLFEPARYSSDVSHVSLFLSATSQLSASLEFMHDHALNDRPGGDSDRLLLGMYWQARWTKDWLFNVSYQRMLSQDNMVYSELLGKQRRQYEQALWRLQLGYQYAPSQFLQCGVVHTDQSANMALSSWVESAISCGVVVAY